MNKEESKKQFGKNLKRLRIERGLSQDELAHALGFKNRSSINKIEIGRSNIPTDKIKKTAEILGVSPLELFGEDPATDPTSPTFNVRDFFGAMFKPIEDSEYTYDEEFDQLYVGDTPNEPAPTKNEEADSFKSMIDDYFSLSEKGREQVASYIKFLKEQEKKHE